MVGTCLLAVRRCFNCCCFLGWCGVGLFCCVCLLMIAWCEVFIASAGYFVFV